MLAGFRIRESWLYDAVEDGFIETIRLGKQLRFRPSAIVRHLGERATNGNGHLSLKLVLV